jgi:hypothetical protein
VITDGMDRNIVLLANDMHVDFFSADSERRVFQILQQPIIISIFIEVIFNNSISFRYKSNNTKCAVEMQRQGRDDAAQRKCCHDTRKKTAAAAARVTEERTYLFAIGPDSQINISKGSSSYSLGDTVFLFSTKKTTKITLATSTTTTTTAMVIRPDA